MLTYWILSKRDQKVSLDDLSETFRLQKIKKKTKIK